MPPWQLPLSLALFLSLSYTHTHTHSVWFSPRRGSPVSLRLLSLCLSVSAGLYGCAGVHRCQLSRIIIHSERMWFPFQITKYGASEHCAPHTSFGCSAIFFLAAISSGLDLAPILFDAA